MFNQSTPNDKEYSVESADETTQKILSESVKPTVVYKLPRIVNLHPKISFATWLLLLALVVSGVVIYRPFFNALPERYPNHIVVNNVRLPKIVNGISVTYGRTDLTRQKVFTTPTQPIEGVIEGVSYGDPFNLVNGIGQGWYVYSKPSEESVIDDSKNYLQSVVSSWADTDLICTPTQFGNRLITVAEGQIAPEIEDALEKPDLCLVGVGVSFPNRIYVLLCVSELSVNDVNRKRLSSVLGAFLQGIEKI